MKKKQVISPTSLFPNKAWFVFLVVLLFVSAHVRAQETWVRAPAIQAGDTIAFVAPAGPVDLSPVQQYADQLRSDGYSVLVPANIDRKWEYLAGTDEQRVNELNDAIRNPDVDAIFAVRGGFGLTRILDQIDYDSLRRFPKIVVGYSDLTALHLAIAKKSRLVTIHGPMPMSNLYQSDAPKYQYANRAFRRTVFANSYSGDVVGFAIPLPETEKPTVVVAGKAVGRLIGGNLSLICATLGTPYSIESQGSILFIEDINEAPYRVDRMLSQLRLAGVFDGIAGAVIGDFSTKDVADKAAMERIFQEYFGRLKVPVLMHFPVGHIPHNVTIPHGERAEIDTAAGTLRLLENPVVVPKQRK